MSTLSRVLTDVGAVFFIALALASVREYRRGRGRAAAWAAVAFVSLGFVGALGLLPQPDSGVYRSLWWQLAVRILLAVIVAIPYFLYRLAATFHTPSARMRRAMNALTLVVIVAGFLLPRIPAPGDKRPSWLIPYAAIFLVQWTATSAFAAVWLWRAGAGRPTAPRYRMRLLAIGCAAFNVVLLFSSLRPSSNPNNPNHVVQALDLAVAAIFFVGLAPPRFLIDRWRRPEQIAVRAAMTDMVGAVSAFEVGSKLLPHVVSYVGAQGAQLVDGDGEVIASYGVVDNSKDDKDGGTLRFELRSGGALIVWSSTYSLMFGADKIPVLQSFADWADLALGRCAMIARERAFISNAAHELRTPLTALTGFADLLERERHNMAEEQVEACLGAMTRQGRRAKDLVNNLLDMAQIERGTMRFSHEVLQLASVVDESIASVPKPVGRIVEIHVPPDIHVRSDRGRLQQVIVNLVTNAYRYGGPSVVLDATVDAEGDVVLSVRDDGEGVPVGLVPDLFRPFARDPAASGAGSGLGLAICKQITMALGGSIVYDENAPGARFVVTLPEAA